jgi:hypothetical protein
LILRQVQARPTQQLITEGHDQQQQNSDHRNAGPGKFFLVGQLIPHVVVEPAYRLFEQCRHFRYSLIGFFHIDENGTGIQPGRNHGAEVHHITQIQHSPTDGLEVGEHAEGGDHIHQASR